MQSIQNLGLAVISQGAGTIVDKKGYLVLEVFFCAWLCGKCSKLNLLPPCHPSHRPLSVKVIKYDGIMFIGKLLLLFKIRLTPDDVAVHRSVCLSNW